jgi:hypothetical protein
MGVQDESSLGSCHKENFGTRQGAVGAAWEQAARGKRLKPSETGTHLMQKRSDEQSLTKTSSSLERL